ncbi:serine/threonine-protein kinase [Streptomyces sp. JJ36]|uniref:serine/threonine-protein kinase n=1 Tax=Streptomyces sp. JJ36 TaxID=2736645 RepID=UPI001F47A6C4|nr:serine/threonine-protein kinase [Streptomyces sp. JJ36]MCF6526182.1 serine/threonine protein kinase [Streptomyces sp. JJ36]
MGQDVEDGRLVGGRYRLEGVLGRGGMGTVWRGRDETLGRTVAVKELRFPSSVEEDEKQRLITRTLREAKAIARIRSGSAVTVFDVVDEDDRPWIVMELIEGSSLADRLRKEGPLKPAEAAEVGLSVLDVLRAAHREGILHRDVKPSNVLLEEGTGRVVLTDFGIAKVEGDPSITSTGMLVGAPSYISPERARGKPPGPPADLWSLGGLLYAAVEGRPPYDKGSALSTLTAVMTEPLPKPRQAGELSEVIYGLLEKDPAKRLDVDGAQALLEAVVAGAATAPAEAPDATRAVALPPEPEQPAARSGTGASPWSRGTTGGRGALTGRSAERLRGALRAVRNAAAAAQAQPGTERAQAEGTAGSDTTPAGATATGEAAATAASGEGAPGDGRTKNGDGGKPAGGASAGTRTPSGTREDAQPAESGAASGAGTRRGDGAGPGAAAASPGEGRTASAALGDLLSRRGWLVVGAVVVVLVVLVVVLATAFAGEDGGNGTGGGTSQGAEQQGAGQDGADGKKAGGGQDGKAGDEPGTGGDTSGNGAGQQDGEAADDAADDAGEDTAGRDEGADGGPGGDGDDGSGAQLPDGYERVTDGRFRHSIAMPAGFERRGVSGTGAGRKYGPADGGYPRLQVDFGTQPQDDAVRAWENLEGSTRSSSTDYRRIGMKEVRGWRDYPTVADWTFERTEGGTRVRVLNRGFKVDENRGYAIMITCRADAWDGEKCRTLRETAMRTFRPR